MHCAWNKISDAVTLFQSQVSCLSVFTIIIVKPASSFVKLQQIFAQFLLSSICQPGLLLFHELSFFQLPSFNWAFGPGIQVSVQISCLFASSIRSSLRYVTMHHNLWSTKGRRPPSFKFSLSPAPQCRSNR